MSADELPEFLRLAAPPGLRFLSGRRKESPVIVASTITRGGLCDDCGRVMEAGEIALKVWMGEGGAGANSPNGPGSWVCAGCLSEDDAARAGLS